MTPDYDIEAEQRHDELDDLLAIDHKLLEDERDYVREMDSMRMAGRWLNCQVMARIRELWEQHCG